MTDEHPMQPFLAHPFDDDRLHEECGVFGVIGVAEAANFVALGLHALQHRGQEAAGITAFDGKDFHTHRAMGHVAGNFDRDDIMRPALPPRRDAVSSSSSADRVSSRVCASTSSPRSKSVPT